LNDFDYPLLCEPINVPRPWGGGRVCKLYDRPCALRSSEPIGETWDISTWPRDPGNPELATVTTITNGKFAGLPLDQVAEVPVVVKLLDSAQKLSVQAHPVGENEHKDEMWYILHAEPGAYLFSGFAEGADVDEFCRLIHAANPDERAVLSLLNKAGDLRPGMHFNVPTGTVHAVGPGLVTFEVSERTQVTYRLFDYNRGRALHLEDGCKAIRATRPDLPGLDAGLRVGAGDLQMLTRFPTFCVLRATGRAIEVRGAQHTHLVTATMGDCRISGPSADWDLLLKRSFTCLVPATSRGYAIDTLGGGEALLTPLATGLPASVVAVRRP
jgi:mannose-6-phosphate isomerase